MKEPLDYALEVMFIPFFFMEMKNLPKALRMILYVVLGLPLFVLWSPIALVAFIALGFWQLYYELD